MNEKYLLINSKAASKQSEESGEMKKMDWQKLLELLKGHKTYIQAHNFPDPDALGSAYGLQCFLKKHGIETEICYDGRINTLSTMRMAEEFNIKATQFDKIKDMKEEDYIILVDGQKYNSNFTDLPGDEVACIDHHPTFIECEYHYTDIRIAGSCSTLIAEYYVQSGTPMDETVASALMYGLRMDTASLTRGVTQLDIDMFGYLYERADNEKIMQLYINTMQISDLKAYGAAIENVDFENGTCFAYIPFECNDALVAMISDFILSLSEVKVCIVYAVRGNGYKMSVRSLLKNVHAGKLISDALEGIGSGGGHAAMAGGVIYPNEKKTWHYNIEEIVKQRFMNIIKQGDLMAARCGYQRAESTS